MGLIQAVAGAVGGMLGDQWKDFYTVPAGLPSTAALFAAVPQGTNAGRGSNTSASSNIITNGSKIVVPEGYGLLLFQDGKITGFAAEPGGYEWRSDDINSKSIFAGNGIVSPLITELGALQVRRPARHAAGGVLRLAEGTAGQPLRHAVGDLLGRRLPERAGRRGHPRLVHAEDRRPDPVREELRAGQLPAARQGVRLHRHRQRRRQPAVQRGGRLAGAGLQPVHERPVQGQPHHQAAAGFDRLRQSLSDAVEAGYQWKSDRGLVIVKTAIVSIEYDANTRSC
jgi:hypothetical protein